MYNSEHFPQLKSKLARSSLSETELSHHTVYNIISDHNKQQTSYFGFKNSFNSTILSSTNETNEQGNLPPGQEEPSHRSNSSKAMSKDYLLFAGNDFSLEEVKRKMQPSDDDVIEDIVSSVDTLLYNITFKLWDHIDKRDENA